MGISIRPLEVKLLAGEQKATELRLPRARKTRVLLEFDLGSKWKFGQRPAFPGSWKIKGTCPPTNELAWNLTGGPFSKMVLHPRVRFHVNWWEGGKWVRTTTSTLLGLHHITMVITHLLSTLPL